jgi:hypothetical protein
VSKEPVGSVGEEAAKLFAVLQQAAADARGEQDHHEMQDEPGTARGSAECQWCPVCQVIHRVKQTSPETVEHLATAAAGVLGSVRSLLEAAAEAARQARADADAKAETKDHDDRPRVDRIDVSEDPEPWD